MTLRRGGRPGPEPTYTSIIEVAFTPEQVARMTKRARTERRSRNALVRDAAELYLRRAVQEKLESTPSN